MSPEGEFVSLSLYVCRGNDSIIYHTKCWNVVMSLLFSLMLILRPFSFYLRSHTHEHFVPTISAIYIQISEYIMVRWATIHRVFGCKTRHIYIHQMTIRYNNGQISVYNMKDEGKKNTHKHRMNEMNKITLSVFMFYFISSVFFVIFLFSIFFLRWILCKTILHSKYEIL